LYSQRFVDQNLIAKTLKGALGGYFSWWDWWDGWETVNYTFYSWPGLESDPYRLWTQDGVGRAMATSNQP
jgi:hypothetical protein